MERVLLAAAPQAQAEHCCQEEQQAKAGSGVATADLAGAAVLSRRNHGSAIGLAGVKPRRNPVTVARDVRLRTHCVFCAVTAVIAEAPYTPRAAKVLRSAWIPAPPPLSLPAMVNTIGIEDGTMAPSDVFTTMNLQD